jgi:hypothetical protein
MRKLFYERQKQEETMRVLWAGEEAHRRSHSAETPLGTAVAYESLDGTGVC